MHAPAAGRHAVLQPGAAAAFDGRSEPVDRNRAHRPRHDVRHRGERRDPVPRLARLIFSSFPRRRESMLASLLWVRDWFGRRCAPPAPHRFRLPATEGGCARPHPPPDSTQGVRVDLDRGKGGTKIRRVGDGARRTLEAGNLARRSAPRSSPTEERTRAPLPRRSRDEPRQRPPPLRIPEQAKARSAEPNDPSLMLRL